MIDFCSFAQGFTIALCSCLLVAFLFLALWCALMAAGRADDSTESQEEHGRDGDNL